MIGIWTRLGRTAELCAAVALDTQAQNTFKIPVCSEWCSLIISQSNIVLSQMFATLLLVLCFEVMSKSPRSWGLVSSMRIDTGVCFSLGTCASSPLCRVLWGLVVTAVHPHFAQPAGCSLSHRWPWCHLCSRVGREWGWRSGPLHSLSGTCFRSVLVEDATDFHPSLSHLVLRVEGCRPAALAPSFLHVPDLSTPEAQGMSLLWTSPSRWIVQAVEPLSNDGWAFIKIEVFQVCSEMSAWQHIKKSAIP